MPNSFTFVLTDIEPNIEKPFEVIDGHRLRKASKKEIKKIKEVVAKYNTMPYLGFPYEQISVKEDEKDGFKNIKLDKDQWRYWVISFEGSNHEIGDLELATTLLENDFEFGFTAIGDMPGMKEIEDEYSGFTFNSSVLSTFFTSEAYQKNIPKEVTKDDLEEIEPLYDAIKEHKSDYNFLEIAFQRWKHLKSLKRDSDMIIIGLVLIIECLITHKPKQNVNYDSIKHQIKTKIPLLSKRFKRNLDYEYYFQRANPEKIWSLLYDYRSDIVHGKKAKVENKNQVLVGKDEILNFLNEATKLLLISSLFEPKLVADLKRC